MPGPDDEKRPAPAVPPGGQTKSALSGWFQKAMGAGPKPATGGLGPPASPAPDAAAPDAPGAEPPPSARAGSGPLPPPRAGSGPLPPARHGSGPLAGQASGLRLPGAGLPRPGSGALPPDGAPPAASTPAPAEDAPGPGRAARTGELVAPAPAEPGSPAPEDPIAASRRRMAFIVAFMKDPTADKDFGDKPLVYRILSEERDYQQTLVATLQEELRRLGAAEPADEALAARREDLETRLNTSQNRQAQLFLQLKKLTGVKGKTGGTGFLKATDLPPGPPVLPPRRKDQAPE